MSREIEKPANETTDVNERWWVDRDRRDKATPAKTAEEAPRKNSIDRRFFRSGDGYDQDRAHTRLTDINLKILQEANPSPGTWTQLQLVPERPFAPHERDKILARCALPNDVHGVCVDSGKTLRLILTGQPVGARVIELVLGRNPSLDVWIDREWVHEQVFADREAALSAFGDIVQRFLSAAAIERWNEVRVQA